MSDVKSRMTQFIEYKKISRRSFLLSCGFSESYFHNMSRGISYEAMDKIKESYPELSISWLVLGEGSMLKSDQPKSPKTPIAENTIKYYPSVNGSMGGIEFLDNPDEFYTDIVLPGFSECKFAVNAFGDSMYPVIKSGQIVIMMPWTERFIDWGHIYMVVTKSGYRAIKYLKPSSKEGCITCESENKENSPAFDVNMEDIHKLYLVKGWICRDAI